jgi:hypothetical protein
MMHGRGKSDPAIVAVKSTLLANIYYTTYWISRLSADGTRPSAT